MMNISPKIIISAISQTLKSEKCRFKHGAVVFDRNEIKSFGHNHYRNLKRLKKYGYKGYTIHAEAHAIIKCREPKGLDLFVVRCEKEKVKNSKPCNSCIALMQEAGIKRVYYTNKYGNIESMNI